MNTIRELEQQEKYKNMLKRKNKEIKRLNNIIKEVKEWILFWKEESLTISTDILDELLEILNKGE